MGEQMVAELGKDEGRMKELRGKARVEGTIQAHKKFRRKQTFAFLLVEALVTELLINNKSFIMDQAIDGLCTY